MKKYRIGKYSDGNARPLKVRMRSQLAVEEITARPGRLTQNLEHKDIWKKRKEFGRKTEEGSKTRA